MIVPTKAEIVATEKFWAAHLPLCDALHRMAQVFEQGAISFAKFAHVYQLFEIGEDIHRS